MMRSRLSKLFALLLAPGLVVALGACSSDGEENIAYIERPVEEIYHEALEEQEDGNHRRAAAIFFEVERQHPYSRWATRAQLMAAWSLYSAVQYDDAIAALDRFIQLHPGNRNIDYAFYLKALCYYEQIRDVHRDQTTTQLALEGLQEVVRRFPDTSYARDAMLKIDLTRDHLAGKEMEVGRFYQRRNLHNAAINRFQTVIEDYQTTAHVPEALHRLSESYEALGLPQEAKRVAAVLGHNFPGSEWYSDSYNLVSDDAARRTLMAEREAAGEKRAEKPGFIDRLIPDLF